MASALIASALRLSQRLYRRASVLGVCALALLLAACGGSSSSGGADSVSVQLDWTPNTNHIGIYVALAKGWYKDAGLNVKLLPYSDASNGDTIVANGKADIGVSFPSSVIFSRAAGLDLVSVASVIQTSVTQVAVLDSSDIKRPRDLDGKTYAGFGLPDEAPRLKALIRADGGQGNFQTATLATAAYDALYNKRADFTEIFTAWEGIEADMMGIKLRTFSYAQYGVPDYPAVVLVAKQSNLTKRADVYRRFLAATEKGYEFAAQQPDAASDAFLAYLNSTDKGLTPDSTLVHRSTQMLAPVFVDSAGKWGANDATKWDAYSAWLLGQGVVTDANSKPVASLPGGPLFTNTLLAGSAAAAP